MRERINNSWLWGNDCLQMQSKQKHTQFLKSFTLKFFLKLISSNDVSLIIDSIWGHTFMLKKYLLQKVKKCKNFKTFFSLRVVLLPFKSRALYKKKNKFIMFSLKYHAHKICSQLKFHRYIFDWWLINEIIIFLIGFPH